MGLKNIECQEEQRCGTTGRYSFLVKTVNRSVGVLSIMLSVDFGPRRVHRPLKRLLHRGRGVSAPALLGAERSFSPEPPHQRKPDRVVSGCGSRNRAPVL